MDEEHKRHIGKKWNITYVGGDYHGEKKIIRAPIRDVIEVARPPKYLGNNYYEAALSSIDYDTYTLLWHADEPFYVINSLVNEFKNNAEKVLSRKIETTNQRLIREELEKKKAEEEELARQKKLAEKDFKEVGFAIEYEGKRLDPRKVRIFINQNHEGAMKRFVVQEKI